MTSDVRPSEYINNVLNKVKGSMYGMDEVIRLCLVALYTNGHVLLEGNPGLGKTALVKALGETLKLPFGRIQFTPDLMPSDITGTIMPDFDNPGDQQLKFQKGPIFKSLLLADEINRATPKTQSAMLEGMAEMQVTVLGKKYKLPNGEEVTDDEYGKRLLKKLEPFIVLATQNPIDHEGTYDLPEAQADRFMFKINMPIPDGNTMCRIIEKEAGIIAGYQEKAMSDVDDRLLPRNREESEMKFVQLKSEIESVKPEPSVQDHIINMFLASNRRFNDLEKLARNPKVNVEKLVGQGDEKIMTYGLGPRAAFMMMRAAKAWSLMFLSDQDEVGPFSLARVVLSVLRHRVKLDFDWEARYKKIPGISSSDGIDLHDRYLRDFFFATAPSRPPYQKQVEEAFRD